MPPISSTFDQIAQLEDDRMRRLDIEFSRVGVFQIARVAREFDARGLHAEANSKVWRARFARVGNRANHSFDAALAKAARHQDRVKVAQARFVIRRPSTLPIRSTCTLTCRLFATPPCVSASRRDLYESSSSTYLPTIAIEVSPAEGSRIVATSFRQAVRSTAPRRFVQAAGMQRSVRPVPDREAPAAHRKSYRRPAR